MDINEENMTTQELMEKQEKEAYLELGKLGYEDANRKKILDELEVRSRIRIAYDTAEQKRLDNYAKNEIEERRITVEEEKAKNEKKRIGADVTKAIIFLVGGFFSGFSGYMLDTWFQKDPRMSRFQEKVHDAILKK